MRHGTSYDRGGFDRYERDIQPCTVEHLARAARPELPQSFRRFMVSKELQSRVRSCTDCYLDPGERIIETSGSICGHVIHFLSDSQPCAHWYLPVLPSGETAVLESSDLYCYRIENSDGIENPACRLRNLELSGSDFA
jgi:hypothetical protein